MFCFVFRWDFEFGLEFGFRFTVFKKKNMDAGSSPVQGSMDVHGPNSATQMQAVDVTFFPFHGLDGYVQLYIRCISCLAKWMHFFHQVSWIRFIASSDSHRLSQCPGGPIGCLIIIT